MKSLFRLLSNCAPPKRYYSALVITAGVLCAGLFLWGLGSLPLMTFNEARRAIPAREMLAHGDWLIPTLNGERYLTKPPFLYWVSASLSLLYGTVNEWTVRLPSALSALALSIMVFRLTRQFFGAWAALFALVTLIANAGFATLGRQAGIEMLLTLLCVSALLSAWQYVYAQQHRVYLWLSYGLLGLAVLTKGPLALLFVTLPLLLDAIFNPHPRKWQVLRDGYGWGLFLGVASAWYVLVTLQLGPQIWQTTVQTDLLNKIHASRAEPIYNYVVWLMGDFFPASLLWLAMLVAWMQRQPWAGYRWPSISTKMAVHGLSSQALKQSLWIACWVPFVLFSLFSDKHAKYLLPIYPLLAILLGQAWAIIFAAANCRRQWWMLGVSFALLIAYVLFFMLGEAKVFQYRVQALPSIARWFANDQMQLPLYAYGEVDERLLYYAQRPIQSIGEVALAQHAKQSFRIVVENGGIATVQALADCTIASWQPYLKQHGRVAIFGFGQACTSPARPSASAINQPVN